MSDEASLLDLVLLQQALETALNRRADVLSLSGSIPTSGTASSPSRSALKKDVTSLC